MVRIDKYKFGEVRYCDCLNKEYGLPSLGDGSFELALTDPPYNLGFKPGLASYNNKFNDKKIKYTDNMEKKEYINWCISWYEQLESITDYRIFTPGYSNKNFWFDYKNFEILIWYNNYRQGGSKVAKLNKFELILCDGDFINKKINLSVLHYNHGFNMEFDLPNCIHPCPKPALLYEWIIDGFGFDSVIDPFLGSGTTAEVCEKLGIKWLGYEIKEEYSQDIEKRLKNVKVEPKQFELDQYM